jgi:glutamyl-tRNA reductase
LQSSLVPKTLFAFGLNHQTAPVEIREKLYLNEAEIQEFLSATRDSLSVLSTCNRTEIFAVSDSETIDLKFYKDLLIDLKAAHGVVKREHFFDLISCTACQHLFSVSTSIDSKIVGDSQILRQLRSAYSTAQQRNRTGKILNQLMQRAFKLGKSAYTETAIHSGAASISLAAVELAVETLGSLQGLTVLVLGAGETAMLTTEALVGKSVGKILLSNRTLAHAEEQLTSLRKCLSFEREILDFSNFKARLDEVDIIISSTGSEEPILYKEDFKTHDRKMLVIDIAVPRDVDDSVRENPNVIVKNIDDLHSILGENQSKRMADLPKVKKMIITEMVEFLTWYYLLPILPEFEKTGEKPPPEKISEILRIKAVLDENVSEIHKFAMGSGADFEADLQTHFSLVRKLRSLKAIALGASA